MDTAIKFLYLSEPDMIKAGVKDMKSCVDVMEDLLITLYKGDYVMGGANHNSHGCMIMFPDDPQFPIKHGYPYPLAHLQWHKTFYQ